MTQKSLDSFTWNGSITSFLNMEFTQQAAVFSDLALSEQDAILREYGDYIYELQREQYKQGLRPEPDIEDIMGDFSEFEKEQEEKAKRAVNMARLQHLQEQLASVTMQNEILKDIKEEVDEEEEETFGDRYDGLTYEHEKGKKAFELAVLIMDLARKYGLPHPDKYEMMLRVYPDVGVISDHEIVFRRLKELENEHKKRRVKFKSRVLD